MPLITTVSVTCRAHDQNGNPVAGARFQATLSATETDNGFVVPERIEGVADAAGVCVLELWPNALGVAGSSYQIRAWNPDTGRRFLDVRAVVPNSDCLLEQIIVQEPYPEIDAAEQALIAAQGALAPVTAQAAAAAASATAAGNSATAASGSASYAAESATAAEIAAAAALTHEQIAAQHRLEASGFADDADVSATEASASAAQAASNTATSTTQALNAAASATQSANSATSSATSASASAASATDAFNSASLAASGASTATAQAGIATTKANQAAASAANAAASEVNASTSKNAAELSATNSATSADASAASATSAAASATTATTKASDAAGFAASSASSATAALGHATAADASADSALTSATEAAASALAAAASEASVAADAAAAATSATNASNSAQSSANSASAASTSASAAQSSASAAAGSASTATTKASEAATSAASALAIYGSTTDVSNAVASAQAARDTAQGYAAAAAADADQTADDVQATGADAAATAADRAQTGADRVQTGLDAVTASVQAANSATSASEALSSKNAAAGSAAAAQADRVQTELDRVATAADRVQTGLDRAATGADRVQTGVDSAAAVTKASEAAASATVADTKASEAASSATSAAADRVQSAQSAATSIEQAGIATTQATNAATSAAAANTSAGAASSSASSALAIYGSTTAQQAAVTAAQSAASLAQGYAASAASVVQQDLSGVTSAALHRSPNAVTAMFLYDTSKDSDGGAWTERCQHTSWFNEALTGKWLGAQPSEFAARNEGATLGAELITNGTFDGDSDWTKNSGWSISGGVAARIPGASATTLAQSITLVPGTSYRITYTVTSLSAGSFAARFSGGTTVTGITRTTAGTYSEVMTPAAGNTRLEIYAVSATNGTIDNISVREVTALTTSSNDYFQLTTDGKFYRLWKNLLSYSNEFDNATWTKTNATITSGFTDIYGQPFAQKLVEDTSTAVHIVRQDVATTAGLHTFTVCAKAGERRYMLLYNTTTNVAQNFDLLSGTMGASTGSPVSTMTPVGDGWYRCSITHTTNAGTNSMRLYVMAADQISASYTGDGTSGIYIFGAQLELGSTATAYEAKTAGGSVSEVFRGNKRKFPKLAGIVAEASNVIIYDLTESNRPMWMIFRESSMFAGFYSSVFALNGVLCVCSATTFGRLTTINFARDSSAAYRGIFSANNTQGYWRGYVAQRQQNVGFDNTRLAIANDNVSAVAMTTLPDAPVDPVTGLKVPTIAIGTASGASVIKHNGTVVNSESTLGFGALYIYGRRLVANRNVSTSSTRVYDDIGSLGANFAPSVTFTASLGAPRQYDQTTRMTGAGGPQFALGRSTTSQINIIRPHINETTRALMVNVSDIFNTGWLTGDIRRAYLADVDAGSVSDAELVTNGDFSNGSTGWTIVGATVSSGLLQFADTATNSQFALQSFSLSANKHYRIDFVGSGTVSFRTDSVPATTITLPRTVYVSSASYSDPRIQIYNVAGSAAVVDSVSVRKVVADRSYKAQGATITGTLTKSQVASAAQLVAYSGFSGANYLREPYSADLDFGTGEWSVGAWVNTAGRKNLLVQSEGFETTSWSKSQSSITASAAISPDGTLNADKIVSAVGSGSARVFQSVTKAAVATTYASTVYAKADEWGFLHYQMDDGTATNRVVGRFDLSDVTASLVTAGGAGFSGTATIYPVENGWYECTLVFTTNTATTVRINYFASDTASPIAIGDGVSGLFIWGAQLEAGSTATDYQKVVDGTELYFPIADRSHSSGASLSVGLEGTGKLKAIAFDGTTTRTVTTTAAYNTATWLKARANYTTDGTLAISVNGVEVAATRGNPLLTLNNSNAVLTIGNSFALNAPFPGSIALLKASATVPTAEQMVWIYEQEKQMFRDGAQVTLPDAGSIVDLTYDDLTDKWMAVSATNESEFSGLIRTSVTPSPAGSYIKVTAASGVQLLARSTTNPGVDVAVPAQNLREELLKDSEAAARMNAQLAVFDYVGGFTATTVTGNTAITSVASLTYPVSYIGARVTGSGIPADTFVAAVVGTTVYLTKAATASASAVAISFSDFILPTGMEAKEVSLAGVAQREGATAQFTRLFDGFKETIRFGTAPSNTALIQIQAARSAA